MIAQAIRAILFASAIATTIAGRRVSRPDVQLAVGARCREKRSTAWAPMIRSRRM